MNKIGIISFYHSMSIGSALQACALQMILKNIGYCGEHIRYAPGIGRKRKYFEQFKNYFHFLRKSMFSIQEMFYKQDKLRRPHFDTFVYNNIKLSKIVYRTEDLFSAENNYDAVICGSDQIWAPNLFDESYFLNFIQAKYKKIAYAPSIGLLTIPDDLRGKYATLIKSIGFLSIREKEGAQIIYDLLGINVPVVLDPTLLIDKNSWLVKVKKSKVPDSPYLLCFFLGSNRQHRKTVEEYQKKTGFKIVVLPFADIDYAWGDIILHHAGPLEFIDLVNRAEMIFTDSFHGAAFSINFNKPFYVFMRFTDEHPICQNSRIRNLLDIFRLHDRLIHDGASVPENIGDIDYLGVNKILEIERIKSINYLRDSLESSIHECKSLRNA